MLQRGQTTEERIGEIAQKFNQGLQGYAQSQRQELDVLNQQRTQNIQAEALRRQQAIQALDVSNSIASQTGKFVSPDQVAPLIQSGNLSGIGDLLNNAPLTPKFEAEKNRLKLQREKDEYDSKQRSLPVNERDDYKKSIAVAEVRANTAEDQYNKRQEAETQKKIKAAQIPDFDLADPGVIPSSKDSEEIKNLNASNKSYQDIGKRVVDKIGRASPKDPRYYLSNDWRLAQQDLTEMKLQAKNLADLGVLNGPDLNLVNETLGSITPTTLALLGPKAAAERVQMALQTANQKLVNAASARGYVPKATDSVSTKQASSVTASPDTVKVIKSMSRAEKIKLLRSQNG